MSSSCTEMLVDHVSNVYPSLESIVFLRALLLDTYSFSEMYLPVEKSLQCRRNRGIEHIRSRENRFAPKSIAMS